MLYLYKTVMLATSSSNGSPATNDALLVYDLNLSPIELEQHTMKPFDGKLGSYRLHHSGARARLGFRLDCAAATSAGQQPPCHRLLMACGMSCVTDENPPRYSADTVTQSIDLYLYCDGIMHRLHNAVGNVRLQLEMHQSAQFVFEFLGIWQNPVATSTPAVSYAHHTPPLILNHQTCDVTLNDQSIAANRLQLDLGNAIDFQETFSSAEILLYERRASANLVYQAKADNDPCQSLIAGDNMTMTIHLQDNHHDIAIDIPQCQWQGSTLAQDQGLWWRRSEMGISNPAGDQTGNPTLMRMTFDVSTS